MKKYTEETRECRKN